MYLTQEQERMLEGEYGEGTAIAMKVLVNIGEFKDAEKLIPVKSAMISGVSYQTGGDAIIVALRDFVKGGTRARIPAYLNPAGMDLSNPEEMKISPEFIKKQMEIIELYRQLGIEITATCTPYYAGLLPNINDHIAWAESSAVVFANSYLGARTNREGAVSALASAITGLTPYYGLHMKENRRPDFLIKIDADVKKDYFPVLAYVIATEILNERQDQIPYIRAVRGKKIFPEGHDSDAFKLFGATLAAYSSLALVHFEGITAEARVMTPPLDGDREKITQEDIDSALKELSPTEDVDGVVFGCPHSSLNEIRRIAELVKGRKVRKGKSLWVFTSRASKEMARGMGYVDIIEKAGGRVFADTCMVVSPAVKANQMEVVLTNSMKAFRYLRTLVGVRSYFLPTERAIDQIMEG